MFIVKSRGVVLAMNSTVLRVRLGARRIADCIRPHRRREADQTRHIFRNVERLALSGWSSLQMLSIKINREKNVKSGVAESEEVGVE